MINFLFNDGVEGIWDHNQDSGTMAYLTKLLKSIMTIVKT